MWANMLDYGLTNSYSALFPDLNDGANPDDSSSEVPYEKGFQFLYYLENQVLKKQDDFRDMLRVYLNKYRGMSVTYLEFRLTFNEWIRANYVPEDAEAAITKVDWNAWVLTPGAIPAVLDFSSPNATVFANIATDYISRNGDSSAVNFTAYKRTDDPNLKVIMLDNLVAHSQHVTPKILAKIDADLNVTKDINPEIG